MESVFEGREKERERERDRDRERERKRERERESAAYLAKLERALCSIYNDRDEETSTQCSGVVSLSVLVSLCRLPPRTGGHAESLPCKAGRNVELSRYQ